MAREDCRRCDGTGFVVEDVERGGVARRCACERPEATPADLTALGLPRRYLHCTLDNYRPVTHEQQRALRTARTFAADYPAVDRGLLFAGSCGSGKTHLAAALLRELVVSKGAAGLFADYQDLLKRIQATYSRGGEGSEEAVLAPILSAELLVLDDLGARRTTEWAEDTVGHLLNVRYNQQRLTIVTTNLVDVDPEQADLLPGDNVALSSRLQERTVSRLHEMCRTVDVDGPDHRRASAGRAGRVTRRS